MDGDIFDQVFAVISENAANGSQGAGTVADWLIRAGLSAAAIAQILNQVSTSADASPAIIEYTQNEMRYVQDGLYHESRTNWVVPAMIGAAALYVASKN